MTATTPEQKNTPNLSSTTTTKTLTIAIALLAITLALFTPLRNSITSLLPKQTTLAMSSTTASTNMKITPRPWNKRGHADHDWLYTFHTFSFASYFSPHPKHNSFGPLRVINEDRVLPSTGFGAHPHAEFLIWSYIVRGTLEHKDSLGNLEYLKRGDVQFTSAGTGIRHSEYNRDKNEECHFLQIWARPDTKGLKPHYETRKFTDEEKKDRLCRIMEFSERMGAWEGKEHGPIGLQADVSMDASILSPGKKVGHEVVAEGERKIYSHVVMGGRTQPKEGGAKIKIGETVLGEGDGAYVEGVRGPGMVEVENVGDREAEFLLFDMGMSDA